MPVIPELCLKWVQIQIQLPKAHHVLLHGEHS